MNVDWGELSLGPTRGGVRMGMGLLCSFLFFSHLFFTLLAVAQTRKVPSYPHFLRSEE